MLDKICEYLLISINVQFQKKVFDDVGRGILENAWNGFHTSLFAYGQTGSGKSWSVIGYGPNKGMPAPAAPAPGLSNRISRRSQCTLVHPEQELCPCLPRNSSTASRPREEAVLSTRLSSPCSKSTMKSCVTYLIPKGAKRREDSKSGSIPKKDFTVKSRIKLG